MMATQELGDCYEANANYLVDLLTANKHNRAEIKRWKLCHGEVLGAIGSRVENQWFAHCWLELDEKVLIDVSNGKHIVAPLDALAHRIKLAEAKRYTVKQAMRLMLATEHYGPWEEP